MKLTEKEIKRLKHFATINGSIIIKPGNSIFTQSAAGFFAAQMKTSETFPITFGVNDLKMFLNILDLVGTDADLNFVEAENCVDLVSPEGKARFRFSQPSVLKASAKSGITLPSVDLEFYISEGNLKKLKAAAGTMGIDNIIFRHEAGHIVGVVEKVSTTNETSNAFSVDLGEMQTPFDFSAAFNYKMLNIPTGSYTVSLSKSGIAEFREEPGDGTITYWAGMSASGTHFDGATDE